MAWRYVGSTTSPAANTPLTLVLELRPSTAMVPSGVSSRVSLMSSVRGSFPMATKTPVTASSDAVPSTRFFSLSPVTLSPPRTSSTPVFHTNLIFSCACARSPMILDALRESRRCTTVTDLANLVRNSASSMAESPPPITAMSWSLKKKPSQVAHQLTPWPDSRFSLGRPSSRYADPVDRIMARAWKVSPVAMVTVLMSPSRSRAVTSSNWISVPKRAACFSKFSMRSGPMMPSGNPG
ncbi:hypothetical protein D9M72_429690 [compost metagenome]